MKFTLSWLKSHLDTSADAATIARTLTAIGLEVESVTEPGKPLAAFRVAAIMEAAPHPNADKLRVCKVDVGAAAWVQVVCGAANARAGLRTVFGAPGTVVPGSGITLKIAAIRGVESAGMLCSAAELQLEYPGEGIMELAADAAIGQSFADYAGLNDPVFEIKLTPNRADCTGVRGIARDLAAAGLGTLKPQPVAPVPGQFTSPHGVVLDLPAPDQKACPYFIGRCIRNVTNRPSPPWLQARLRAIGLRPISALVDITNFLTFDQGRPLHVFDAKTLQGDIRVRQGRAGESLEALNGKTYPLDATITVIADAAKPLAIAGIIGGMASGCDESTTELFLECAYFDPSSITLAGRKLNILSDARYRFERGVDPGFMLEAAEMATRLILELCGGAASELLIVGALPPPRPAIFLAADRCARLGGHGVALAEQQRLLQAIGCTVSPQPGGLSVTFPTSRPDMVGEADCVEELLRLIGFEAIAPVALPRLAPLTPAVYTAAQKRVNHSRRVLAARGLLETVTFSFMAGSIAEKFAPLSPHARILNPISADLDVLRPAILPNLLRAAQRNLARGLAEVNLFEVGPVYQSSDSEDSGISQTRQAASLRCGLAVARQWAEKPRQWDVFDAKADALAVLAAAGLPIANLQISTDAMPDYFHPTQSGAFRLGSTLLAYFGTLHPALLQAMEVATPAVGCVVFLDSLPLLNPTTTSKPLADLPSLHPLTRDFAFVVGAEITAAALVRAVKGADKTLITAVAVFDVYAGKGVDATQKSIALAVTLQPRTQSLTEADLEAVSSKIIAAAAKATGAVLRA